jgi:hypothetical protein
MTIFVVVEEVSVGFQTILHVVLIFEEFKEPRFSPSDIIIIQNEPFDLSRAGSVHWTMKVNFRTRTYLKTLKLSKQIKRLAILE